jgi:GDP-mannose 6-dehydrogenase
MTTSVSIFGLGYVGCVSAACFAREGFHVVGVDVDPVKLAMIRGGKATIVEEGIADLVQQMVGEGRLTATDDAAAAVQRSDVSLVCVGTPSQPNGRINLEFVERVCGEIGQAMKYKSDRHTVLIRSTVLPGTTERLVVPILEAASGKRARDDFGVGMNPEFLREGTSIRDFYDPPFTVLGVDDDATEQEARALYRGVNAPVFAVRTRVAEMVKYACNCFHGVKIAFANEIGNLAKAVGADGHEVMRLVCEDRKLNISTAYLKPGFAFGGSCLPKDLRATTFRARELDIDTPLLSGALESNERQIERAFRMVTAAGSRRVGVLGLSFKAGTDDLRESPIVALVERLIGKGHQLAIYDRDVRAAQLIGSNKQFIEREIPHIWSLMRDSVAEVIANCDVLVIGNGASEFREIAPAVRPGQMVVDLVRAFGARTSDGDGYEGICW